jgi:hypothetical protein
MRVRYRLANLKLIRVSNSQKAILLNLYNNKVMGTPNKMVMGILQRTRPKGINNLCLKKRNCLIKSNLSH